MLSDQFLEPASPDSDEYTRTCHNLKGEFPNSFIFYLEQSQLQEQLNQQQLSAQQQSNNSQPNSIFIIGDDTCDSLNSDMRQSSLDESFSNSISSHLNIDPLNAANLEYQQQDQKVGNSRFYNALQNQRNAQLQKSNSDASKNKSFQGQSSSKTSATSNDNSREMINDWIGPPHHSEYLKLVSEAIAETIDFMLK